MGAQRTRVPDGCDVCPTKYSMRVDGSREGSRLRLPSNPLFARWLPSVSMIQQSSSPWNSQVPLVDRHQPPALREGEQIPGFGCDTVALLSLLSRLKMQAEECCGETMRVVSIHEAGLDGFWVHRLLKANGIDSHVVDAASIAVERRRRRVKTDRIDVEKLLRKLMGWARGERRICSMVRPPNPQQEDARRLTRERETLITERVQHVNRIKGLLATQGIFEFQPLRKYHRERLEELRRWDGQPLPPRLKAELLRELQRLELVLSQISAAEAERDLALKQAGSKAYRRQATPACDAAAEAGGRRLHLRKYGGLKAVSMYAEQVTILDLRRGRRPTVRRVWARQRWLGRRRQPT
jgi:transposase